MVVDGPALVHMNAPTTDMKTFGDYCHKQIPAKLLRMSSDVSRADIVFDVYRDISLKQQTRESRSTGGLKISIREDTLIQHKNFKKFLGVNDNKSALFCMLADAIASLQSQTKFVSTKEK